MAEKMQLTDRPRLHDELLVVSGITTAELDEVTMDGGGFYELRAAPTAQMPWGELKQAALFDNLITDTGDKYYGDRAAYQTAPANIYRSVGTMTAATNANPSVITFTAHGLGIGDVVKIGSVTPVVGATGLNGTFVVTAATANTFSVTGFTGASGPGVWSSGGDIKGPSLPSAIAMKLGTTGSGTPVAKNGAGSSVVSYSSGSAVAFDATFPNSSSVSGWRIQYKTTWVAGVATVTGLAEVVIVAESLVIDATTAAAATLCRAILSPVVNKGSSDSLAVTWNHTLLGT